MGGTSLLTPKRLIRALRPGITGITGSGIMGSSGIRFSDTTHDSGHRPMFQQAPGKLAEGCQRMHFLEGFLSSKEVKKELTISDSFRCALSISFFLGGGLMVY